MTIYGVKWYNILYVFNSVLFYIIVLKRCTALSFSSPVFIFFFLPAVFILERMIPGLKSKNIFLAAVSIVFLAFGQLSLVPLFLASVLINYISGLLLIKMNNGRKAVLAGTVLLDIGMLAVFKYSDFIILNINSVFSSSLHLTGIALPLGISFFTFQGISYVADTYRNREKGTGDFMDLLLFMSFFPQFIQGPILRFEDFAPQIICRTVSPEKTVYGIRRFITGLAKKVIISAAAAKVADSIFAMKGIVDWRLAWLGGICYAVQLYYDFSGYSDMAVGLARIFGFGIIENFDYPYSASSVRNFWRRWHISLSTWFRDYLYIPLGGSREGKGRKYLNRMIVFLCTGIWHGANWTFIIWGLFQGVLINLEDSGIIPVDRLEKNRFGRIFNRVYTLLAVMLLFVIFRAESISEAFRMIRSMFAFSTSKDGWYLFSSLMPAATCVILVTGLIFSGRFAPKLQKSWSDRENSSALAYYAGCLFSLLLFALCLMAMSRGGFTPFIYTQF